MHQCRHCLDHLREPLEQGAINADSERIEAEHLAEAATYRSCDLDVT